MAIDYRALRDELATKENILHDRLAEITQRLSNARATIQIYEEALQKTVTELTKVREELEDVDRKIESTWNRPAFSNGEGSRI